MAGRAFLYGAQKQGLAAAVFILGGAAYLGVELAWRGMTTGPCLFAGGLCLCGALPPGAQLPARWRRWRCGPRAGVLLVELAFGLFCTRLLGVPVWDYSGEWGNLAGLVCPKYTLLWFLLCLWLLAGLRGARWVASAGGYGDKVPKTGCDLPDRGLKVLL